MRQALDSPRVATKFWTFTDFIVFPL